MAEFDVVIRNGRVVDGFVAAVRFEMALGNVSELVAVMHQHVVPGLVFRWTAQCNLPVPFLAALETGIDIDNDAAVVEFPVMDELSNEKQRLCLW